MPHDLSAAALWMTPHTARFFRALVTDAPYPADEPYHLGGGRFCNDMRLTLYVADSAETAMSEWLRHNPEMIDLQQDLLVSVFAIDISWNRNELDVRTADLAALIPFPFDRLISNEADCDARYRECRDLADSCEAIGGGGITWDSPSTPGIGRWNSVFFGNMGDGWVSVIVSSVDRPQIPSHSFRPIPVL
jgi:hypothetical protein